MAPTHSTSFFSSSFFSFFSRQEKSADLNKESLRSQVNCEILELTTKHFVGNKKEEVTSLRRLSSSLLPVCQQPYSTISKHKKRGSLASNSRQALRKCNNKRISNLIFHHSLLLPATTSFSWAAASSSPPPPSLPPPLPPH